MKYSDLVKSNVMFDEASHTYTASDGRVLSGVTSIISHVLYPDKYKNVPSGILANAAKRGTDIHVACQLNDLIGQKSDCIEVKNYEKIKHENQIEMIASEYLVSDGVSVATMIDCIDSDCNLYDIKTTSVLDEDYLSWQLSFCAYLFEKQNPSIRVSNLYGIWLRGSQYKLVEVKRKPDKDVVSVIEAYMAGGGFVPSVNKTDELSLVFDIESEIIRFKEQVKMLEESKKKALENLKARMVESGTKKIETEKIIVTLVPDGISRVLDRDKLKKEHPDIVNQYLKDEKRTGYVKITIR